MARKNKKKEKVSLLIKCVLVGSLFLIAVAYFSSVVNFSHERQPKYVPGDCSQQDFIAMVKQVERSRNVCGIIRGILDPNLKVYVSRDQYFYSCNVGYAFGTFSYLWDNNAGMYRWWSIYDDSCKN